MAEHDVVIVGGGIAGTAAAYFLARRGVRDVVVLERESRLGFHSTTRAAGVIYEYEPDLAIQQLIAQGGQFFRAPPPGFAAAPVLDPTGILELLDEGDVAEAEALIPAMRTHGTAVELVTAARARELAPPLTIEGFAAAVHLPEDGRLAIDRILGGYASAGRIRLGAEVSEVIVEGDRCRGVVVGGEALRARVVVNAAGAWATALAALAGAIEIPMQPLRRTIAVVEHDVAAGRWPLVYYAAHQAYMAPEGPGVMVSPLDEDPVPPCDAQPDPAVVQTALDRLAGLAQSWSGARLHSCRAGLRTFAADRRFVIGADPHLRGFVWLAGLGGWGIETSPAYGRIVTEIITEGETAHPGAGAFAPARFA